MQPTHLPFTGTSESLVNLPGSNSGSTTLGQAIQDLKIAGDGIPVLCKDLRNIIHQRAATLDSAWSQFYSSQALLIDTAYRALLPALALMQDAEHFPDASNATALASTYVDILAKLSIAKTLWVRLVNSDPYCSPSLPMAPLSCEDAEDVEDASDVEEATNAEDKSHTEDVPGEEYAADVPDVPQDKVVFHDLLEVVEDKAGATAEQVVASSANYLLSKPDIKLEQHEYSVQELRESSSHCLPSTHASFEATGKHEPDESSNPATCSSTAHFSEPREHSIPVSFSPGKHEPFELRIPEPRKAASKGYIARVGPLVTGQAITTPTMF
ncbi:hypothetical protein B0H21DRAFT_828868 [Amylocystis lapponica]|nr:hypothetical protein B0H21DRAFT_828868 [Amylocystis lapponica]